ncbi:hypothetical protein SAMN05880501_101141 [Ureibacillus xyleni]|uniref:Uncharacterized protein n=2 Tax=Ureibacillus xyleni TaxID=614648 RepID=A0A285R8A2_9BACL|nr:hypothetical protein SAMN05880501_101141 [Ureibacillus xyleni]
MYTMKTINLPILNTRKNCFILVECPEEGYFHISWLLKDNSVVLFENIQDNYPSEALVIYDSIDDYFESIQNVDWLHDEEWVVVNNAKEYGFPFFKK